MVKRLGLKYVQPSITRAYLPARQEISSDIFLRYMRAFGAAPDVSLPREVQFTIYTRAGKYKNASTGQVVDLPQFVVTGKVQSLQVDADVKFDLVKGTAEITWYAVINNERYYFKPAIDDNLVKVGILVAGFADSSGTRLCCYKYFEFDKSELTSTTLSLDIKPLRGARVIAVYVFYLDKAISDVLERSGAQNDDASLLEHLLLLKAAIDGLSGAVVPGGDVLGETVGNLSALSSAFQLLLARFENALGKSLDIDVTNDGLSSVETAVDALRSVLDPIMNRGLLVAKAIVVPTYPVGSIDDATFASPIHGGKPLYALLNNASFISALDALYKTLTNEAGVISSALGAKVKVLGQEFATKDVIVWSDEVFNSFLVAMESYASYLADRLANSEVTDSLVTEITQALMTVLGKLSQIGTSLNPPLRLDILLENGVVLTMFDAPAVVSDLKSFAQTAIAELQSSLPLGIKRVTVTSPLAIVLKIPAIVVSVASGDYGYIVKLSSPVEDLVSAAFKERYGTDVSEYAAQLGTTPVYFGIIETAMGPIAFPATGDEVVIPYELLENSNLGGLLNVIEVGVGLELSVYYAQIDPELSVSINGNAASLTVSAEFEEIGYVKKYGFDIQLYGVFKRGDKFYVGAISLTSDPYGAVPKGSTLSGNVTISVAIRKEDGVDIKTFSVEATNEVDLMQYIQQTASDAVPVMLIARTAPRFVYSSSRPLASDVYINTSVLPRLYRVTQPLKDETGDALPAYLTLYSPGEISVLVTLFKEDAATGVKLPVFAKAVDIDIGGGETTVEVGWGSSVLGGYDVKVDGDKILVIVPESERQYISEIDLALFDKTLNAPINAFPSFAVYDFAEAVRIGKNVLVRAIEKGAKSFDDVLAMVENGEIPCKSPVCVVGTLEQYAPDLVATMRMLGIDENVESVKDVFIAPMGKPYSLRFQVLPALFLILLYKAGLDGWGLVLTENGYEFSRDLLVANLRNLTVNTFDAHVVATMAPVMQFFIDQLLPDAIREAGAELFGDVYDLAQSIVLVNVTNSIRLLARPTSLVVVDGDESSITIWKDKNVKTIVYAVFRGQDIDGYHTSYVFDEDTTNMTINLVNGAYLAFLATTQLNGIVDEVKEILKEGSITDPTVRNKVIKAIWDYVKENGLAGAVLTNVKALALLLGYVPMHKRVDLTPAGFTVFTLAKDSQTEEYTPSKNLITVVKDPGSNVELSSDVIAFKESVDEVVDEVEEKVKSIIEAFLNSNALPDKYLAQVYLDEPFFDESGEFMGWTKLTVVPSIKALLKVNMNALQEVLKSGDLANPASDGTQLLFITPAQTTSILNIKFVKHTGDINAPFVITELLYPVTGSMMPIPITWVAIEKLSVYDVDGWYSATLVGTGESYIGYQVLTSKGVQLEKYSLNISPPSAVTRTEMPEGQVALTMTSYGSVGLTFTLTQATGSIGRLLSMTFDGQKVVAPGFVKYNFLRQKVGGIVAKDEGNTYTVYASATLNDGPEVYFAPAVFLLTDRKVLPDDMPVNVTLDSAGDFVPVKAKVVYNSETIEAQTIVSEMVIDTFDVVIKEDEKVLTVISGNVVSVNPAVIGEIELRKDNTLIVSAPYIGFKWLNLLNPTMKYEMVKTSDGFGANFLLELTKYSYAASALASVDSMKISAYVYAADMLCGFFPQIVASGTMTSASATVAVQMNGDDVSVTAYGLENAKVADSYLKSLPELPNRWYAEVYVDAKVGDNWVTYAVYRTNDVYLPEPIVKTEEGVDEQTGEKTIKVTVEDFGIAKRVIVGVVKGFFSGYGGLIPLTEVKCLTPSNPEAVIKYKESDYSLGLITTKVCNTTLYAKIIVGSKVEDVVNTAYVFPNSEGTGSVVAFFVPYVGVADWGDGEALEQAAHVLSVYKAVTGLDTATRDEAIKDFAELVVSSNLTDEDIEALASKIGVDADALRTVLDLAKAAGTLSLPVAPYQVAELISAIDTGTGRGFSMGVQMVSIGNLVSVQVAVASLSELASGTMRKLNVVHIPADEMLEATIEGGEECEFTSIQPSEITAEYSPIVGFTQPLADAIVSFTGNDPTLNAAVLGGMLLAAILSSLLTRLL